jgi:phosphatidylserine/phosphatidylglycerophosphate/cardiolipin synthase-like enzyme
MNNADYQHDTVELVITPPEPYGASLAYRFRARMTLGVIIQLIAQAHTHILIASPFLQDWDQYKMNTLGDSLKHAIERGVHIDIVSTGIGVEIIRNSLTLLNSRGKINLLDEKILGSHAKIIVTDSQHAYIGSANLTSPGLTGNLEMGVMLHGGVAAQISAFWKYLIDEEHYLQHESL